MATLVPLPAYADLPRVVVFHREHPGEPLVIMQVPMGDTEEFETYRVRLDSDAHKRWMSRLPNARNLSYQLTVEPHLAYFPHNEGTVLPLDDLDAPSELQKVVAKMRAQPDTTRSSALFARRRQQVPGISRLRLALSQPGRRGLL